MLLHGVEISSKVTYEPIYHVFSHFRIQLFKCKVIVWNIFHRNSSSKNEHSVIVLFCQELLNFLYYNKFSETLFKYANKALFIWMCTNFNKSEHWIKPGSKFLFDFAEILKVKGFIEGILDFSFYHSINQRILSTAMYKYNFTMFLGIRRYIG